MTEYELCARTIRVDLFSSPKQTALTSCDVVGLHAAVVSALPSPPAVCISGKRGVLVTEERNDDRQVDEWVDSNRVNPLDVSLRQVKIEP